MDVRRVGSSRSGSLGWGACGFAWFPFFVLLLVLPVHAAVEVKSRDEEGRYEVHFRYTPVIGVKQVFLAGSFNEWKPTGLPMSDPEGDGSWELILKLEEGRHLYKFVLDGHVWQTDPENPSRESDGFEGFNSVVVVGAPLGSGGIRGDGKIEARALRHRAPGLDANRFSSSGMELRLWALAEDVESVEVLLYRDEVPFAVPMRRIETRDGKDQWWTLVQVSAAEGRDAETRGREGYYFRLRDGETEQVFGKNGFVETPLDPGKRSFSRFGYSVPQVSGFQAPDWVRDAVFYQIFPERFANGDRSNDPEGAVPWGSEPTNENFMGGDLAGILQELDHIEKLGVRAIYLNPVFAAKSNHKYDTSDFLKVDPAFGDAAALKRLVEACHARGIRVILDGVFNHSGDSFWAFQDVVARGRESAYVDWYRFHEFPVVVKRNPGYDAWWGFGHLPEFNIENEAVREYLWGVGVHWLKEAGIDGWRLDVPNEVPESFWREFRKRVRSQRQDAYFVGEIWVDPRPWVSGDIFDAVMNYPLRALLIDGLIQGKLERSAFLGELDRVLYTPPAQATLSAYNLLGSHDTPRILTIAGGSSERVRLALVALFSLPGAPAIYYGDETGLGGGKDPECRRAFPWSSRKSWDDRTLELVKQLAGLRREKAELRALLVDSTPVAGDVSVIVFRRETLRVVLNPTTKAQEIRIGDAGGGPWRDLLSEWEGKATEGWLEVPLSPLGYRILEPLYE